MPEAYLAILDVGHGNAAVLVDRDGAIVIDAGNGDTLLEFLDDEGLDKIDVALVSHADSDHIGGLIGLLACGSIITKRVCLNPDASKGTQLWDDLVFCLDHAGNDGLQFEVSLTSNHTGEFDRDGIRIEILAPSSYLAAKGAGSTDRSGRTLTSNSMSAVIRLVKNSRGIALFPGDLDSVGLDNLATTGVAATADVLVFPHHGGLPRSGDPINFARQFVQMVLPQIVVFSIGRGFYETPQPEVVDEVRRSSPGVKILCTQLSTRCAAHLPQSAPKHLSWAYAKGKNGRRCCAGSLVINLDKTEHPLLPLYGMHQDFVREVTTSPVCQRQI